MWLRLHLAGPISASLTISIATILACKIEVATVVLGRASSKNAVGV